VPKLWQPFMSLTTLFLLAFTAFLVAIMLLAFGLWLAVYRRDRLGKSDTSAPRAHTPISTGSSAGSVANYGEVTSLPLAEGMSPLPPVAWDADEPASPPVPLVEAGAMPPEAPTLADQIEEILQALVARQLPPPAEELHVINGLDGGLEIHLGSRVYHSMEDLPPGPAKELLQAAVAHWNAGKQAKAPRTGRERIDQHQADYQ